MRKFLATIIVSGILLLLGSVPCLADTGTGIGISAEATVVAGDSGTSGGGWGGSGYSTTMTTPTTVTPPAEPVITSPPPIYIPPKNDTPAYTPEPPVIPPQIPDSTPWFYLVIVFGGLLGIYGLIRWLQRKG